jgi:hypothetical protein
MKCGKRVAGNADIQPTALNVVATSRLEAGATRSKSDPPTAAA